MNPTTVAYSLLTCVLAMSSAPAQERAPNPVLEQARKMPLGAIAGQRPLRFGFHDGTRDVTVEVIGSLVRARTAEGPFPESRTVRRDPALFYLDQEGGVVAGLHLWPGGGRLQVFSERFRLRLGVSMNAPAVDKHLIYRLPIRAALEIVEIEEGGVAWRAGARHGDVLIAIDGTRPVNRTVLRQALTAARPGGRMAWTLLRGGEELEVDLALEQDYGVFLSKLLAAPGPPDPNPVAIELLPVVDRGAAARRVLLMRGEPQKRGTERRLDGLEQRLARIERLLRQVLERGGK